jgi:hypothetical protein
VRVIIWIANHALWISLVGAICTIGVRFETFLPRPLHKLLLFVSLFVTFASPLLGMLKKTLDDQWKAAMQRDIERERTERVRLDEKFSARRLNEEQRAIVLNAFKDMRGRLAYVRCIDEAEACLAAHNFAAVLREAGLVVPEVEGVGLTVPATIGIEIYDPTGEQGVFAKTLLSVLPDARFRPAPFVIGGQALDPASPAMVVRMKVAQRSSEPPDR